jgi:hypothetical protein
VTVIERLGAGSVAYVQVPVQRTRRPAAGAGSAVSCVENAGTSSAACLGPRVLGDEHPDTPTLPDDLSKELTAEGDLNGG